MNSLSANHKRIFRIAAIFCRITIGLIFLYTFWGKIGNIDEFVVEIDKYGIVPAAIIYQFAASILLLEIFVASTLILGLMLRYSLPITMALLLLFIIAIAYNLLIGSNFDCGCTNFTGSIIDQILGRTLPHAFIRDIVLLGMTMLSYIYYTKIK